MKEGQVVLTPFGKGTVKKKVLDRRFDRYYYLVAVYKSDHLRQGASENFELVRFWEYEIKEDILL